MYLFHVGTLCIFIVQEGQNFTLSTPFLQHYKCLLVLISLQQSQGSV